ncbi:MAG: amino acid ABC transporter substrate-binding protein [Anaerotruncus sp.]|nr:amino acid ABC transporter substrate-binding protein [Anaerotruncus sp.]
MKKTLSTMVAALLCVALFGGCGSQPAPASSSTPSSSSQAASSEAPTSSEAPASSTQDVAASDGLPETFIVGLDASFPPMGFLNQNNEVIGVDIDLAKAVCEKLGMKFEAKPIEWDAKDMELSSDKITCIWNGLTVNEERAEIYELSEAYMENEQVIVVLENAEISGKADLEGKIVAAQKDSSGLSALQADEIYASIQGGAAKEYSNYVEALTDLEIGRCDAVVMDSVVADYYITQNAKPMKILEEKMAAEQYAIAFKKGNTALKDAVWGALQELAAEGKVADISHQWFGKDDVIQIS